MDLLFDSDSLTAIVCLLSVTSRVAASASSTRIYDFLVTSHHKWHFFIKILSILSMIFRDFIAIARSSMKHMFCIFAHR